MHVSEHYKLGLHQGELDFVDVSIETDTPLFIDPRALLLVRTDWGQARVALVQDFFRYRSRGDQGGQRSPCGRAPRATA